MMTPTPYAISIREQVHRLVQQAEAVLTPEREIDLGTLKRTFTVQCNDAVTTAAGPALLARVRAAAPKVSLQLLPEAATDTSDLRQDKVDLREESTEPTLPDIRYDILGEDRVVVVMRTDEYRGAVHRQAQRPGGHRPAAGVRADDRSARPQRSPDPAGPTDSVDDPYLAPTLRHRPGSSLAT